MKGLECSFLAEKGYCLQARSRKSVCVWVPKDFVHKTTFDYGAPISSMTFPSFPFFSILYYNYFQISQINLIKLAS